MPQIIQTESFELAIYAKGDPASTKVAIVIPGRLDTKDYIHNTSMVDTLADEGYYAVSFDPPGTWESPGNIELYTMTNCVKAVNELIEYFGNKPTLLAGHSRGGSIAMYVGPRNPHVTQFVSVFSTYSVPTPPNKDDRIINGALIEFRDLPPGTERTKEKKRYELPLYYFEDAASYDSLESLRSCTKPKLFFYGMRDTMNNPAHTKEAFEASAGPKQIMGIDSEHDYRLHADKVSEVNVAIRSFAK